MRKMKEAKRQTEIQKNTNMRGWSSWETKSTSISKTLTTKSQGGYNILYICLKNHNQIERTYGHRKGNKQRLSFEKGKMRFKSNN
jgi:hypothetical protein